MAYENRKLAGGMQAIVDADGPLETKCARESRHRPFSKGPRSEQITIRTSKRATRASINDKKVICLIGSAKTSFCEDVLPTAAGSTILLRCQSKSEFEHKNMKDGPCNLHF